MLQDSIAGKASDLGRKGTTVPPIPAMEYFFSTPWKQLAEVESKEAADTLLHPIAGLSTLVDNGYSLKFYIVWECPCPSCFEFAFKDPPPVHGRSFASLKPIFERCTVVLHDCPLLDDVTGNEIQKTIQLEVISCDPLISSGEATAFKFRAADEPEHQHYSTFVPPELPSSLDSSRIEYWQLVRTTGADSQAMSLIRVGCLDSIFKKQVLQCHPFRFVILLVF
jgi:hypothetical protein